MSSRYFVVDSQIMPDQNKAILTDSEANHLVRVMRKQVGDAVILFDGQGHEFDAFVTHIGKESVELQIQQTRTIPFELPVEVSLAVALPKGDRQKWMIEKLTELGCKTLIPLTTERGISKTDKKVIERLNRQVIEAAKQCGRSSLMTISQEQTLTEIAATFNGPKDWKLLAHPSSDQEIGQTEIQHIVNECCAPLSETSVSSINSSVWPIRIVVAIGPEGGFSSNECRVALECGWSPVNLGPLVYRIETAALVAAALLTHLPFRTSR